MILGQQGRTRRRVLLIGLCTCWLLTGNVEAQLRMRIRDLCRIKGQEENTLTGLGLVVGLKGTGDADPATIRALSQTMHLLGTPVGRDATGQPRIDELKDSKNVALVFVSTTIPGEGAREGSRLDCVVNNAHAAKSLAGGYLLPTPLLGPRPGSSRIYGIAQGKIRVAEAGSPVAGTVHNGCRMEENVGTTFVQDGKITLVIDKKHASFETAAEIETTINSMGGIGTGSQLSATASGDRAIAKAIDQSNVVVQVPPFYKDDVVGFIATVMAEAIVAPQQGGQVVIDREKGVLIIGDNVRVARVAVTHKNLSIQTGPTPIDGPIRILDQPNDTESTPLQALVSALNALQVSTEDIIAIVMTLDDSHDLYGRLVIK